MNNFLAARSQMGMSLGFHIIFAVIGMALPMMMSIAEWRWRTTADPAYLEPTSDWPNVRIVHICFQVMVGCGSLLSIFSVWAAWFAWKKRAIGRDTRFLKMLVAVSPLGFIALEAGWMVTELGRQPWIIYHIMRTRAAVTSMPNIVIPFVAMTVVYLILGVIALWLLSRHVIASPATRELQQLEVHI